MDDLISRQAAIDAMAELQGRASTKAELKGISKAWKRIEHLPSAQPERLTDDDFETIRIHLNAYKEKLCNQQRWEEAEEYQRIIDRFMAFASAQAETNCSEIPNNCPAADVVPVVRCDDCVYYGSRRWCELHSSVFDDNAFCSYGERKE